MGLSADFDHLADEHRSLVGRFGQVQRRCSELVTAQAAEIERLRGEVMRLRAQVIARDSALAFAREDLAALEASIPGLPARLTLARRVEVLMGQVRELMRERLSTRASRTRGPSVPFVASTLLADLREKVVLCIGRDESGASFARRMVEMAGGRFTHRPEVETKDTQPLEESLLAADLVICQAGCVSHDDYWRVQDLCRRTGKQCMLVEQPRALEALRRRRVVVRTERGEGGGDA